MISSQSDGTSSSTQMYYGDQYMIGDGFAYTWIEMDASHQLLGIGISINDAALASLPMEEEAYQYSMSLPKEASSTPFKHALLDWAPVGHEPPGIYDLPHFDAHFYVISESERLAIGLEDAEHDVSPDHSHVPAGYDKIPGGVPAMGAHWVDPTSPEFNGEVFTETFIFGSYDGEVTFLEPMFTLAYLQENPKMTKSIKMPDQFDSVWSTFPTEYSIKFDRSAGEYSISLHGFVNE